MPQEVPQARLIAKHNDRASVSAEQAETENESEMQTGVGEKVREKQISVLVLAGDK